MSSDVRVEHYANRLKRLINFMWIALTNSSRKTILLDLSKAIQINPSKGGSQIIFAIESEAKPGERRLKSVSVAETIPEIGRALNAKPAK